MLRRRVTSLPAPRWEAGLAVAEELGDRVAVLASWSSTTRVSRSVDELVHQLSGLRYRVIVVSACEAPGLLDWPRPLAPGVTVLRRPNRGYDFGSWAATLALRPEIADVPRLLLLNDSLLGPFAPIDGLIADFEASRSDVWGLISTTQDAPHLQSHGIGYRDGVLRSPRLARFWRGVRVERSKKDVVRRYEIGYRYALARSGVRVEVRFPWQDLVHYGGNPTSLAWRRLLQRGFPFVKRELVVAPPPEVVDSPDVPAVLRQMYGVDVRDWV